MLDGTIVWRLHFRHLSWVVAGFLVGKFSQLSSGLPQDGAEAGAISIHMPSPSVRRALAWTGCPERALLSRGKVL